MPSKISSDWHIAHKMWVQGQHAEITKDMSHI